MAIVLRLLFGLALGIAGVIVCIDLGLLIHGQPDSRTLIGALLLLSVGQWISFLSFRHHIARQVLFGFVLCLATAIGFFYSSLPLFWEQHHADPAEPGMYLVTWRSDLALLFLLALTQGISFVIFRWNKLTGAVKSRVAQS
jgi:hypothetical protein